MRATPGYFAWILMLPAEIACSPPLSTILCCALACIVPTRRARRIQPTEALRTNRDFTIHVHARGAARGSGVTGGQSPVPARLAPGFVSDSTETERREHDGLGPLGNLLQRTTLAHTPIDDVHDEPRLWNCTDDGVPIRAVIVNSQLGQLR